MRSSNLRASGLGSKSFENDKDVTLSPRLELEFDCATHGPFSVTFSTEVTLPGTWDCPTCWVPAARSDGVGAVAEPVKPTRTPWDMLRERRSEAMLEEILAERLALLRSGAIGPGVPDRITPRKKGAA